MPPLPHQPQSINALEGPPPLPLEQCAQPIGCVAVGILYDSALNNTGFRYPAAHRNDPLPLSQGARLERAIDAEQILLLHPRCLACPLRRTTLYPHDN